MSGPDAHRMLKSKVSALSYIDDVNIYDSEGQLDQLIGVMAAVPADQHCRPRLFQDSQIEPAISRRSEPRRFAAISRGEWTTVIARIG